MISGPFVWSETAASIEVNHPAPSARRARKQGSSLFRKLASKKEVNRDVVVGFPNQKARILQTPLDVRHDKMSFGSSGSAVKMYQHSDSDFVRRAQQGEDTSYLEGRFP